MLNLPMLGTEEKNANSRYQITLVNCSDKSVHPLQYERLNRFFENKTERDNFVNMFERSILQVGGKLVYDELSSHPSFASFDIYDDCGRKNYELTVYK